jgi:hypothetical protein
MEQTTSPQTAGFVTRFLAIKYLILVSVVLLHPSRRLQLLKALLPSCLSMLMLLLLQNLIRSWSYRYQENCNHDGGGDYDVSPTFASCLSSGLPFSPVLSHTRIRPTRKPALQHVIEPNTTHVWELSPGVYYEDPNHPRISPAPSHQTMDVVKVSPLLSGLALVAEKWFRIRTRGYEDGDAQVPTGRMCCWWDVWTVAAQTYLGSAHISKVSTTVLNHRFYGVHGPII